MVILKKRVRPVQVWGESLTLPDQSLTVKEIFARFRKGLTVSQSTRTPIYVGDEESEIDLEKVSRLSRMEKIDLVDDLNRHHDDAVQRIKADKAQRAAEAAERKKAAEKKAEKQASSGTDDAQA